MRDDERLGRGQLDERAEEQALRDVVVAAVMYGGAILATALLAILLFAAMEAFGIWSSMQVDGHSLPIAGDEEVPRRIRTWARWATKPVGG
jgi:hypothetical protein